MTATTNPNPPVGAGLRRTMHDDALEVKLKRDGFVVVDLASEDEVRTLTTVVAEIYRGERSGFHSTLQSADAPYRRDVFDRVTPVLADRVAEVLDDHEPFAASLTIKWPGEASALPCHQDWTMVDESRFRSVAVWVPLVDTDGTNGVLGALPGSHRFLDHIRCSPMNPADFRTEETLVRFDELEPIPVRAGQAIIFDNGVVHGSDANRSADWRPAVTVAYRPAEATLLHHYLPDPDGREVEVFEVDPEFFSEISIGERPKRPVARTVQFSGTPRDHDELLRLCGRERTASDEPGSVARTMLDDALERQLDEQGFVVVDTFDPKTVAALNAAVDELFDDEPVGFHASNMCDDHAYRRAIYERALPIASSSVLAHFVDHEPCTSALMLKFPGEDSGFLAHQDWTLVDESRYRSVNVWCPLVDSDVANGTLRVLPGSHLHLRAVRCDPTYPSDYRSVGWDVRHEEMVPVPVRAGQALIFDHRLLHCSGPNLSADARPAFTVAVKPRAAELLHWLLPEPESHELEVYRIDDDFLLDFNVGERPNYPLVRVEEFQPDTITRDELLRRCGVAVPTDIDGPAGIEGPAHILEGPPVTVAVASSAADRPVDGPRRWPASSYPPARSTIRRARRALRRWVAPVGRR